MHTDIGRELERIKERNRRVELDKAWETSWTRRVFIAVLTYVVAGIWLAIVQVSHPWATAFVPTAGYVLSTLTLPLLKRWWMARKK